MPGVENVLAEKVQGGTEENKRGAVAQPEVDPDCGVFLTEALPNLSSVFFAADEATDAEPAGAQDGREDEVGQDLVECSVCLRDAGDARSRDERHAEHPEEE